MRRRGALGISPALVLALGLLGCGSEVAPSPVASQSAGSTPSRTAAPRTTPLTCPDSPQTPQSPLPALGDTLKVPGSLCSATYEGVADIRGLNTVTLTIGITSGHRLYFAPTVLKGTAGESVKLHIVDTTHLTHNISIPEESINMDIPVGGTVDVVVTFPAAGPLVYFCSYHDVESQAGELLTVS